MTYLLEPKKQHSESEDDQSKSIDFILMQKSEDNVKAVLVDVTISMDEEKVKKKIDKFMDDYQIYQDRFS